MTDYRPLESPLPFNPPFWLRPALVQTIVASQKFRKRGRHPMEGNATTVTFQTKDGVTMQGSYSKSCKNKALVIFLHGWEGSENSTYVMSCARLLYDKGCSIFRLNFRDHGDTHSLNEEIFHSGRTDEVLDSVVQAGMLAQGAPIFLAGFSLGGNFALRIGRDLKESHDLDLKHIFAISPVVDPLRASPKVDENPFIQRYFKKKWVLSMRKKQAAFPKVYNFEEIDKLRTVLDMTEVFLPRYTEFQTPEDYFNAYKIHPNDLTACPVPISMIMAKDDPVIPADDMLTLTLGEKSRAIMLNYGGHNGFFESLNGPTWYDKYMQTVILGEA